MSEIKIKSLAIENFKGISTLNINFADNTNISGRNASGKTTVLDALMWTLFDCDSQYRNKFAVRPLDKDGNMVHNVEIKVAATLVINGDEYELTKLQKEIWVKHRGHEEAEFEGNKNEFSINGYPKSDKDYKAFIAENIGDLEVFKMLIDPRYFPNLDWKKQRSIIMSLYKDVSDADLAASKSEFSVLSKELNVASTDDIKAKYSKALRDLKEKHKEIPIRIDEANNSKVDIDASAVELQKADLESKLESLQAQINNNDNSSLIINVRNKRTVLFNKIENIKIELAATINSKRAELRKELLDIESKYDEIVNRINSLKRFVANNKSIIDSEQKMRVQLGDEYANVQKSVFDDSIYQLPDGSDICPNCGQKLPQERIDEIVRNMTQKCELAKSDFENKKSNKMKELVDKANKSKADSAELENKIASSEKEIAELENTLSEVENKKQFLTGKINELPTEIDTSDNEEIKALEVEIAETDKEIEALSSNVPNNDAVNAQINEIKAQISECDKQLAAFANNALIDDRIETLREEQIATAQKVADQEKMLYTLEEFIKYKLNFISSEINKHFKQVNIRLFNTLINGSVAETCECTLNGVPYSNLNNGHKIIAGLDIISSLNEIYGINTMVFIDNCESINADNLPNMGNQIVSMYVSEDKVLKVEV